MTPLLEGCATVDGTRRFRARHEALPFRTFGTLHLSALGLGSYLGEPDDDTDAGYRAATQRAMALGINVLDTAINYRHQRSERALGAALRAAVEAGLVARDEIIVASKAGFLPFDGERPAEPAAYLRATYIESGIARPDEIVAGCHCLSPAYLADQLARSRHNLGLQTIDIYYLHNPEMQRDAVDVDGLLDCLRSAFTFLESARADGWIRAYGAATWHGLRVGPEIPEHLPLTRMVELAREIGGEDHGFRVIQAPCSATLREAVADRTQPTTDGALPAFTAATASGLYTMSSASLMQGALAGDLPGTLGFLLAQKHLGTALIGTRSADHVEANLAALHRLQ